MDKNPDKQAWKDRFALREQARKTLYVRDGDKQHRTCTCGNVKAEMIDIMAGKTGAHAVGVETCGSVWSCPVCAAKICQKRSMEVVQAMREHLRQGGAVYFLTLTAQHWVGQECAYLRDQVGSGWTKMTNGNPWKRLKADFGIEGFCRALETKHGGYGWHNHLHVLLFLKEPLCSDRFGQFQMRIFGRWAGIMERLGSYASFNALDLQEVSSDRDAALYITKMGLEITHIHQKGFKGGYTPFQLLARSEGCRKSRRLFREYAAAFKGKKHLTWSRGLKQRYGVDVLDDVEIAEGDEEERVLRARISSRDYIRISRAGRILELFEIAIDQGQIGVDRFLARLGVGIATREGIARREFYFDGVIPNPDMLPDQFNIPMAQQI